MAESQEQRRPRPIGVADESEEDSDMEGSTAAIGASSAANDTAADSTAVPAPDETNTTKKTSRKLPAFSENDLVKEKGLLQIYKQFPEKCRYKGKGREAEFLRGLMVAYKEWGYQLYPGVAFEDLASRTEKLGGKARTRDLMRELRDTERDRVIEARYGRAAVQDVHAQEAARLAAKESKAPGDLDEEEAEEGEDEDLASSRYMDLDDEQSDLPGLIGDGRSGREEEKKDGGRSESQTNPILSEQVRQRMETNRRLALERLRLKKEQAAAASGQRASEGTAEATSAMHLDTNSSGGHGEPTELMDVDEGAAGEPDDESKDDEAALADMQAEGEETVPTAANSPSTESSSATAVAPPKPFASRSAGVSDSAAAAPAGSKDTVLSESTSARGAKIEGVECGASGTTTAGTSDVAQTTVSGECDETAKEAKSSGTPSVADATSGSTEAVKGEESPRACGKGESAAVLGGENNGSLVGNRGDTPQVAPISGVVATLGAASFAGSKVNSSKAVDRGDSFVEATSAGGNYEQASSNSPVK